MKATGIVRRIDDLGRVVVPKELRRSLRIHEGDPIEIFTNREGEIILKKYSQIGEIAEFAVGCAEAIGQTLNASVVITDREQVVAVHGLPKKEWLGKSISGALLQVMQERGNVMAKRQDAEYVPLIVEGEEVMVEAIVTIISEGDAIGTVAVVSKEETASFGETERKVAMAAAAFLGKRLE